MSSSSQPHSDPAPLEPILLPDERQELAALAFFQAELERIRARTLISDEAFATVATETQQRRDAIEVRGFARAEFEAARGREGARAASALGRDEISGDEFIVMRSDLPQSLPPGVLALDGWADRLIVLSNCAWVLLAAWHAIQLHRKHSDTGS